MEREHSRNYTLAFSSTTVQLSEVLFYQALKLRRQNKHSGPTVQFTKSFCFRFSYFFILHVQMFCLSARLHTICLPGTCGSQARASEPLALQLGVVVSCCVGAGNQTQAACESSQRSLTAEPPCWRTSPLKAGVPRSGSSATYAAVGAGRDP